jgi:DNA-binding response OmpR family regulator
MQKILIVDDEAELRETISILLEHEQFVPIQAWTGNQRWITLSVSSSLMLVDLRFLHGSLARISA